MLTMADQPTLDPSRLVFSPVPTPSYNDVAAIPLDAHVVLITWPDSPPDIAGMVWDQEQRDELLALFNSDKPDAPAGDVFMFYVSKRADEDAIIRRAMDLTENQDLNFLDSARPVYSEQDVVEMIRTAVRLHGTPF
jgi:hypothetical protein